MALRAKGKRLIFTDHARQRMRERGITPDDIRQAIEYPSEILQAQRPDLTKAEKQLGSFTVQVVYAEAERDIIVVTAIRR